MRKHEILDQILTPADVKKLKGEQLPQLCRELREEIVDAVSQNGGHLAPNLGVVELTVALHRVFDLPKDKILWDVGHQTYAHKLLTGRRDRFGTIRRYHGLSSHSIRNPPNPQTNGSDHAATERSRRR